MCVKCGNEIEEERESMENMCKYCYFRKYPQLSPCVSNCNRCNIELRMCNFVRIYDVICRDLCMDCYELEKRKN